MKRIENLYSIFIFYKLKVDLPFLDRLYSQCYSKDIGLITKFLFNCWYCRGSLWDLHSGDNKKFLCF